MSAPSVRPLGQQIEFVQVRGGKVHVLAPAVEDDTRPLRRIGDGPPDPVAWMLGVVQTRCGRNIARNRSGHLNSSAALVRGFPDDLLCVACYRTVAPDEQHRLFEHPQEDEADDDE